MHDQNIEKCNVGNVHIENSCLPLVTSYCHIFFKTQYLLTISRAPTMHNWDADTDSIVWFDESLAGGDGAHFLYFRVWGVDWHRLDAEYLQRKEQWLYDTSS